MKRCRPARVAYCWMEQASGNKHGGFAAGGGGRPGGAARAVGGAGRWRQRGGSAPCDWRSCARRYRIWDRGSIDKTAARGRAAPVPFAPAAREAVFTLALFVIPIGPWAEEQVVPDGMGTDAEPPVGPHLLSLADVGALGFDCSLKPTAAPTAGGTSTDLNTPVTTSDLPAFFPNLLEPPPISGATLAWRLASRAGFPEPEPRVPAGP